MVGWKDMSPSSVILRPSGTVLYKTKYKQRPFCIRRTHSLTSPTLASTDFCACSPWDKVSLVVGNSSWCQAAALPVGTSIRLVNNDVTRTRRSFSRCSALTAATFNCSDVNCGISTGGGGGAVITPVAVC